MGKEYKIEITVAGGFWIAELYKYTISWIHLKSVNATCYSELLTEMGNKGFIDTMNKQKLQDG